MDLLASLRPYQWTKNVLVFAGLVFSLNLLSPTKTAVAVGAFVCFCAASSSVYLFNDIRDREHDRLHPEKRLRPIAAGRVSVAAAAVASAALAVASVVGSLLLNRDFALVVLGYLLLQTLYSMGLKQIAIVDVLCIATGFVLRAVAGAVVVEEPLSAWLLICTSFLSLFIALSKRRHEVSVLSAGGVEHRPSLAGYTVSLLDQLIAVATAATLISYALYTMDPVTVAKFDTSYLPITLPVAVYGLFRFLTLVHRDRLVGDPSLALLRDRQIAGAVVVWGLIVVAILYVA